MTRRRRGLKPDENPDLFSYQPVTPAAELFAHIDPAAAPADPADGVGTEKGEVVEKPAPAPTRPKPVAESKSVELSLDFAGEGETNGLDSWRENRARQLEELCLRTGIPLNCRVEVRLTQGPTLRGTIHLADEALILEPGRPELHLQIDQAVFSSDEVESVLRLDDEGTMEAGAPDPVVLPEPAHESAETLAVAPEPSASCDERTASRSDLLF